MVVHPAVLDYYSNLISLTMLPECIYAANKLPVPEIQVEVLQHVDLGERVICTKCTVNGLAAKRLTQDIYGLPVNEVPVWNIKGRIVATWFAELLESKYQRKVAGQTIIIYPDFV